MYTITVFGKEVFKSDDERDFQLLGLELLSCSWKKDVKLHRNQIH